MKLNIPTNPIRTHEGAVAKHVSPELQLRRSVMACLLWEGTFYEDGQENAKRIQDLVAIVPPEKVAEIAIEAREKQKLRHVPLLLVRALARTASGRKDGLVSKTLERVIQRPDELSEFLAIYWKEGRCKIAKQVQKGLARAFAKFSPYSIAKYNRDGAIKLRDVAFLTHPKAWDGLEIEGQEPAPAEAVARPNYRRGSVGRHKDSTLGHLIAGTLPTPDTWEVALSAGGKDADKKAIWNRLLSEEKLGALALLRNLRNMEQAGVDREVVRTALKTMKTERVLPYRFIAAARHAPHFEPQLEEAMFRCLTDDEKLKGRTVLLVDVSGSMSGALSSKSDLLRIDAACGLAMLLREICDDVEVYTFSTQLASVAPRRGFALRDAIVQSQPHASTMLGAALQYLDRIARDRIIVITDEQSQDSVPDPKGKGYIINVATERNGVGYGPWNHVDGFSEAIVDYIRAFESTQ